MLICCNQQIQFKSVSALAYFNRCLLKQCMQQPPGIHGSVLKPGPVNYLFTSQFTLGSPEWTHYTKGPLKRAWSPRAKFKWKHQRMLYFSKNLGFRHWSQARCIPALRPTLYFIFFCLSNVKSQLCVRHGVFVLQFTSLLFPLASDLKWARHLCHFVVLGKKSRSNPQNPGICCWFVWIYSWRSRITWNWLPLEDNTRWTIKNKYGSRIRIKTVLMVVFGRMKPW